MSKIQLKNLNESLKSKKIQFKQFMMTAYKPKQLFYGFKLVLDLRQIKNNKLPYRTISYDSSGSGPQMLPYLQKIEQLQKKQI